MQRMVLGLLGMGAWIMMGCGAVAPEGEKVGESAQEVSAPDPRCLVTMGGSPGFSSFSGIADTQLEQSLPTHNEGFRTTCLNSGGADQRHCLVRWDVSSLAPTTTVQAACVQLNVTDTSASIYGAFQVYKDWSEMTATWQNAKFGTPWQVPGAWGAQDSSVDTKATVPASSSGLTTIALDPAVVQQWISNPSSNYGLLFGNNNNTDSMTFTTRESGSAPRLLIIPQ